MIRTRGVIMMAELLTLGSAMKDAHVVDGAKDSTLIAFWARRQVWLRAPGRLPRGLRRRNLHRLPDLMLQSLFISSI